MVKRSEEDYAEMSRAVEAGDYNVPGTMHTGATLRMGRPLGGGRKGGSSPARTIRLPADMDARLQSFAEAHHSTPSDVMRRALDDYLQRSES